MKHGIEIAGLVSLIAGLVTGCSGQRDETATIGDVRGTAIVQEPADGPAPEPEGGNGLEGATEPPLADSGSTVGTDEIAVTSDGGEDPGSRIIEGARKLADATAGNDGLLPEGYEQIGFDRLAGYEYDMPEEWTYIRAGTEAPPRPEGSVIPDEVGKLDGQPIGLTGFMLPLKLEDGLVTELLLMRDRSMCCYGTQPKITEWVSVKMRDKGVKPLMDEPVTLLGTLNVGEIRENGYLVGLYEMDGDSLN